MTSEFWLDPIGWESFTMCEFLEDCTFPSDLVQRFMVVPKTTFESN
jgi:hypothetical protein